MPAIMKNQPRRAIPTMSAMSGCTGPEALWKGSSVAWLYSIEAMEFASWRSRQRTALFALNQTSIFAHIVHPLD
jgi:hypothetical protein